MNATARRRLLLVLVLLLGHVALFPLFASQPINQSAGVLPSEEEFVESPESYLGDRVVTGGVVQETSPLVIQARTTSGTHPVRIIETPLDAAVGDKIRVVGTFVEQGTVRTENAFVVPQRGRWYAWGISFLAGLWVLSRLVRHWTVDRETLGFRPRDEVLTVGRVLGRTGEQEGSDDA